MAQVKTLREIRESLNVKPVEQVAPVQAQTTSVRSLASIREAVRTGKPLAALTPKKEATDPRSVLPPSMRGPNGTVNPPPVIASAPDTPAVEEGPGVLERVSSAVGAASRTAQGALKSATGAFVQGLAEAPAAGADALDMLQGKADEAEAYLRTGANKLFGTEDPRSLEEKTRGASIGPRNPSLGTNIREAARTTFPERPEYQESFLLHDLPGGAASIATQFIANVIGGPVAGAALMSVQMGVQGYNEALEKTGDPTKASRALIAEALIGLTEQIPIGDAMALLKRVKAGNFASLRDIGVQGLEEGAQEFAQGILSNIDAAYVSEADPNRPISQGVLRQAAAGFILGGAAATGIAVVGKPAGIQANAEQATIAQEQLEANKARAVAVRQGQEAVATRQTQAQRRATVEVPGTAMDPNEALLKGTLSEADLEAATAPETGIAPQVTPGTAPTIERPAEGWAQTFEASLPGRVERAAIIQQVTGVAPIASKETLDYAQQKQLESTPPEQAQADAVAPTQADPAEALKKVPAQNIGMAGGRLMVEPSQDSNGPMEARMPMAPKPLPDAVVIQEFQRTRNLPEVTVPESIEVDEARGQEIARLYEAAQSAPDDPVVRAQYEAFNRETQEQFEYLTAQGYVFEPTDNPAPYQTSEEMRQDISANKHLFVWTGGSPEHGVMTNQQNFAFRAVHDTVAHGLFSNQFGHQGEEGAWAIHSQMYSDEAVGAMTTEARGQNNTLHFSEQLKNNPDLMFEDMADAGFAFPEQKAMLLPKEYWRPQQKLESREGSLADVQFNEGRTNAFVEPGITLSDADKARVERVLRIPENIALKDKGWAVAKNKENNIWLSNKMMDKFKAVLGGANKVIGGYAFPVVEAKRLISGAHALALSQELPTELFATIEAMAKKNKPVTFRRASVEEGTAEYADSLGTSTDIRRIMAHENLHAALMSIEDGENNIDYGQARRELENLAMKRPALHMALQNTRVGLRARGYDVGTFGNSYVTFHELLAHAGSNDIVSSPKNRVEILQAVAEVLLNQRSSEQVLAILKKARPSIGVEVAKRIKAIVAEKGEPSERVRETQEEKSDRQFARSDLSGDDPGMGDGREIAESRGKQQYVGTLNKKDATEYRRHWEQRGHIVILEETKGKKGHFYVYDTPNDVHADNSVTEKETLESRSAPKKAEDFLTENEKIGKNIGAQFKGLTTETSAELNKIFGEITSVKDIRAAAERGQNIRAWYARSARALAIAFGKDAPQFIRLLAAMSPQQSVKNNIRGALAMWREWEAAGRPTEYAKLKQIAKREGIASYLGGKKDPTLFAGRWNNVVAVLSNNVDELSGMKVEAFWKNLSAEFYHVTNDVHQGRLMGLAKAALGDTITYLAVNAKVRMAASQMEGWSPAEVQAASWSFQKVVWEMGLQGRPVRDILREVTSIEKQAELMDFAELLTEDPDVRKVFETVLKANGKTLDSVAKEIEHANNIELKKERVGTPFSKQYQERLQFHNDIVRARDNAARFSKPISGGLFDDPMADRARRIALQVDAQVAAHNQPEDKDKGSTFYLGNDRIPEKRGFAVSIRPDAQATISPGSKRPKGVTKGQIAPSDLYEYMEDTHNIFQEHEKEGRIAVGTWFNYKHMEKGKMVGDDKLYFDVSMIVPTLAEAKKLARQYGQKAIRDMRTGNTIMLEESDNNDRQALMSLDGPARPVNVEGPAADPYKEVLKDRDIPKSPAGRLATAWSNLRNVPTNYSRGLLDRFVDVRQLRDRAKEEGIVIAPEADPYMALQLEFGGGMGRAESSALHSAEIMREAKREGRLNDLVQYLDFKGYIRVWNIVDMRLKDARVNLQVIKDDLVASGAEAALDLKQQMREMEREIADLELRAAEGRVAPKGITRELAEEQLEHLERSFEEDGVLDKMKEWTAREFELNREALDMYHEEGLVNDFWYNVFVGRGKEYIHMARVMDLIDPTSHKREAILSLRRPTAIQRIEGSARANLNPFEADINHRGHMMREIAKNRASRKLIDFAELDPEGWGTMIRKLKPGQRTTDAEGLVTVVREGKAENWAVPWLIAQSVTISNVRMNEIFGGTMLGLAARSFRAMTTGVNLAFALPNLFRDVGDTGAINVPLRPGEVLKFVGNLATSLKHIATKDEAYHAFLRSGNAYSTMQKNIDARYFIDAETMSKSWIRPGIVIEGIVKFNSMIEEMSKMAARQYLIDAGMNETEAAWRSRHFAGTPDVGNGGYHGPMLNNLFMYFTAAVKGAERSWHAVKDNPKKVGEIVAAALMGEMALAAWNASFMSPDDDDREIEHVSRTDRKNYYVILLPFTYEASAGNRRYWYVKIPRPFMVGQQIGGVLQEALEPLYMAKTDLAQGGLDIMSDLLPGQFALKKNRLAATGSLGLIASVNPLVKGPLEQAMNVQAFGEQPIVPRGEEDVLPEIQYDERTSPTAVALGTFMSNMVPGSPDWVKSPRRIEHIVRTFASGVGDQILSVMDAPARFGKASYPFEGPEAVTKLPGVGPIVRRFVGSGVDQTIIDVQDEFYTLYNRANVANNSLAPMIEGNDGFDEAVRKYKRNPELIVLAEAAPVMRELTALFKDIHELRRQVVSSEKLTDEQKRTATRELFKGKSYDYKGSKVNYADLIKGATKIIQEDLIAAKTMSNQQLSERLMAIVERKKIEIAPPAPEEENVEQ